MNKKILVTGCAGFVGFHLINRLIKEGYNIIGIDNLNDYYDVNLKESRLKEATKSAEEVNNFNWKFLKGNIENRDFLEDIFKKYKPETVFHLAAQAGVRYSIENPHAYISSNLLGFGNIIECCRNVGVENFIYASSSSVYGGNQKLPFSEIDQVNHPVSLYAATKKSNELIAHAYSHLYSIPSIGLRFFTVYGPWGRPDMAPMLFADAIFNRKPIDIYNYGNMSRDFTFIDDIIETLFRLINKPAMPNQLFNKKEPDPSTSWCKHRIFNIGNSQKIELMDFIFELENVIGIKAIKNFVPMHKGDVVSTISDSNLIQSWTGFKPNTSIKSGVKKFIDWYQIYYMNKFKK